MKTVDPETFLPLLRETTEQGGCVPLTVTGGSMQPFLSPGRDQVLLGRAPERLKKYDVPLYLDGEGRPVLHRVIRAEKDGTYTCCGDRQTVPERGVRPEQILALAVAFRRKGRMFPAANIFYRCFCFLWTLILPHRGRLLELREGMRRKKKKGTGRTGRDA